VRYPALLSYEYDAIRDAIRDATRDAIPGPHAAIRHAALPANVGD